MTSFNTRRKTIPLTVISDALPMNSWYGLSAREPYTLLACVPWAIDEILIQLLWDSDAITPSAGRIWIFIHYFLSRQTKGWGKDRNTAKSTVILSLFFFLLKSKIYLLKAKLLKILRLVFKEFFMFKASTSILFKICLLFSHQWY